MAIISDVINDRSGAKAPLRIAEELAASGFNVTIYALEVLFDRSLAERMLRKGVKICLVPVAGPYAIGAIVAALKLAMRLRSRKHDVISCHANSNIFLACLAAGTPVVRTYYGTQSELGLGLRTDLLRHLPRALLDRAVRVPHWLYFAWSDAYVTISEYLRREARRVYGRDPEVVLLGCDFQDVKYEDHDGEEVVVLSVSRLAPYKGFHNLIMAFIKARVAIQKSRLEIVGSQSVPGYLDYLMRIKPNNSSIHTDVDEKDLRRYYSRCDIYASCDEWVPWSLTMVEAASYGKAIVALDRGAAKEIVAHNISGLLAKDTHEFEQFLALLLHDGPLRKALGYAARNQASQFTWEKTSRAYAEVMRELVETSTHTL